MTEPNKITLTPEEAETLAMMKDFAFFAEAELKVQTKEGTLVNFKLNATQRFMEQILADIECRGLLIRLIILKARQMGISTWVLGRSIWKTIFNAMINALVVTHDPGTTDYLFGVTKRYYNNLSPNIQPPTRYSNKKLLEFNDDKGHGLDSAIRVGMAGGKEDLGSGQMTHLLHASELAKYPAFIQIPLMTSLLQCVPGNKTSEVYMESTAKGIGGYFYDQFWGARFYYTVVQREPGKPMLVFAERRNASKNNTYIAVFLPWFCDEQYVRPFTEPLELSDDEIELKKRHNLTDEQLNWRRWKIENDCAAPTPEGKLLVFKQEYPSDPREAFIASGRTIFDAAKVLALQEKCPAPKALYDINTTTGQWHSERNGRLKVWSEPEYGRQYIIAADVAEGLTDEERDFSDATVIDWVTGDEVASWHGKIPPEKFALVLFTLGDRYNNALLIPEKNLHGYTVIQQLRVLDYENIAFEMIAEPGKEVAQRYGFVTSGKTRPLIINNLISMFNDNRLPIKDKDAWTEFLTFKESADGRLEAESGFHDDCVFSRAIAYYHRAMHPIPPKFVGSPQHMVNGRPLGGPRTTASQGSTTDDGYKAFL
jgi:hypothetical protein